MGMETGGLSSDCIIDEENSTNLALMLHEIHILELPLSKKKESNEIYG